jgi:uncharacterized protein (DUF58 family)
MTETTEQLTPSRAHPDESTGPTSTVPWLIVAVVFVLLAVLMVALHTWFTLTLALLVLYGALVAGLIYVERLNAGRASPADPTLSVHDLPADNPSRRTVAERQRGPGIAGSAG